MGKLKNEINTYPEEWREKHWRNATSKLIEAYADGFKETNTRKAAARRAAANLAKAKEKLNQRTL